VRRNKKT